MHGNPTKMHVHERNNIPCGSMVLRNKKCDRTKATGCNFWYGSLNSRFIHSFTFDSSSVRFSLSVDNLRNIDLLLNFLLPSINSIRFGFQGVPAAFAAFLIFCDTVQFSLVTCLSISGKSIKTSSKSLFFIMITSQYIFARTSSALLSPNIKPTNFSLDLPFQALIVHNMLRSYACTTRYIEQQGFLSKKAPFLQYLDCSGVCIIYQDLDWSSFNVKQCRSDVVFQENNLLWKISSWLDDKSEHSHKFNRHFCIAVPFPGLVCSLSKKARLETWCLVHGSS